MTVVSAVSAVKEVKNNGKNDTHDNHGDDGKMKTKAAAFRAIINVPRHTTKPAKGVWEKTDKLSQ